MAYPTLSAQRPERFAQALAAVEAGIAAGQIANVVLNDAKPVLNRAIDQAWEATVSAPFAHQGRWEALPREVYDFYSLLGTPELHTLAGKKRKLDATRLAHPMIDAMRALVAEAAPLGEQVALLRTLVVKRQPRPVEDRRAKYMAPKAGKIAIGAVKRLLEEMTDAAYQDLRAGFAQRFQHWLDAFLAAQAKARGEGRNLRLDAFYGYDRRHAAHRNPAAFDLVCRLLARTSPHQAEAIRDDAAAEIQRLATKHADEIRDAFVFKNLAKLDSIMEAKGNFQRGEIVGWRIEMTSLRGGFRFHFADGSHFVANNSVVWSYTQAGREYNRFPLTFHEVVLPGGAKMPRPSEARMNTLFVGLPEDAAASRPALNSSHAIA